MSNVPIWQGDGRAPIFQSTVPVVLHLPKRKVLLGINLYLERFYHEHIRNILISHGIKDNGEKSKWDEEGVNGGDERKGGRKGCGRRE